MRNVSISPDGSTIVFSYRGDLWLVPAEGGKSTPDLMGTADSQGVRSRSDALLLLWRQARSSLLHPRAWDDPKVLAFDRLREPRARASWSFSAARGALVRALLRGNVNPACWRRVSLRLERSASSGIHPTTPSRQPNGLPTSVDARPRSRPGPSRPKNRSPSMREDPSRCDRHAEPKSNLLSLSEPPFPSLKCARC